MALEGKLCISVIEARNVLADTDAELSFYVRLRMGAAEVKTDVARNSVAPKFLKDVRMGVVRPETDVLRIELLQCGPRGDLVVGSDELQVSSILNKGTIVHWFELTTFDEEVTAELCLVLRYLQAGMNRPMTPSYALAARDAKQRAIDNAPQHDAPKLQPSKALFTDLEPKQDQAHMTAAATPAPGSAFAPNTPARQAASPFQQPVSTPTKSGAGTAAARSSSSKSGNAAGKPWKKVSQWLGNANMTMPLALVGGALLGAAISLLKARGPGEESDDLGAICSVGVCMGRGGVGGHMEPVVSLQPGCRLRIPARHRK